MCVAYPARVTAVFPDGTAEVVLRGRPQRVLLMVLADADPPVAGGDWLLVQSGLALDRLDPTEAARHIDLLDEATGGTA